MNSIGGKQGHASNIRPGVFSPTCAIHLFTHLQGTWSKPIFSDKARLADVKASPPAVREKYYARQEALAVKGVRGPESHPPPS